MSRLSDVVEAAESLSIVEKVLLIKQLAEGLRDEMPLNKPRTSPNDLWDEGFHGNEAHLEGKQNQWRRFLRDNL